MDNRSIDLPDIIDTEDAQRLDDAFAAFEEGSFISSESRERILSSVMERAGFDMKDTKITHNRFRKKSIVFIIAAAAVLLTAAISAAAIGIRRSRDENVQKFLGESAVDFLEENEISNSQEAENPHFKAYLDTILSDGNYCRLVMAYEALDEQAEEQLKGGIDPHMEIFYSDTGEKINMAGSEIGTDISCNTNSIVYFVMSIPLYYIDTSRPVSVRFNTGEVLWDFENECNLSNGIELDLDMTVNVKTKLLTDERGRSLLLSPIGLSCCASIDEWSDFVVSDVSEVRLTDKNGGEHEIYELALGRCDKNNPEFPGYGNTFIMIRGRDLLDIDNISGIRIDDSVFFEESSK